MDFTNVASYPERFSSPATFNPNFKIPVKSQPPPPGTEIEALPAPSQPALPLQGPMPSSQEMVFQSPMFNYDPSYWTDPNMTATYAQYGQQALSRTVSAIAATAPSQKRKPEIDYMQKNNPDLPEELKKEFNALHCKLCDTKMNGPTSARMHYESKIHDKKVNQWLADWAKRTGQQLPKRQRKVSSIEQAQKDSPKGPNAYFCELCQIPLTSVQHANQHFTGKRHRMVAAGKSCPKGSGFYDKDGNWVKQAKPEPDATGRFGIGTSFIQPLEAPRQKPELVTPESPIMPPTPNYDSEDSNVSQVGSPVEIQAAPISNYTVSKPGIIGPSLFPVNTAQTANHASTKNQPKQAKTKPPGEVIDPSKHCEICDVTVTSVQQMETHKNGVKHQKKCKQLGLTSVPSGLRGKDNFSSCRTPSGQFYCKTCDLTVATETLFVAHVQSKKHIKNAKEKH